MGTEMKKILCLILVVCCAASFFACGGDDDGIDQAFFDIIESSKPTKITTLSNYSIDGEQSLLGEFQTVIGEDGFEFTYSYERFARIEDAADGNTVTVDGEVIFKNGLYSTDGGNTWDAELPDVDALNFKLNICAENLGGYTLSSDNTELTTTLTAAEAEALLGIKLDTNSDVEVTIKTNGMYLTRVMVYYTTERASVSIETSYTYNA